MTSTAWKNTGFHAEGAAQTIFAGPTRSVVLLLDTRVQRDAVVALGVGEAAGGMTGGVLLGMIWTGPMPFGRCLEADATIASPSATEGGCWGDERRRCGGSGG